jgi:snRNA-activating protein complex subunit 3
MWWKSTAALPSTSTTTTTTTTALQTLRDAGIVDGGPSTRRRDLSERDVTFGRPQEPHVAVDPDGDALCVVAVHDALTGTKTHEYACLASQSLAELRDVIYCVADRDEDGAACRNSACLCIEQVFYVDTRDPTAPDLAQPIIDWISAGQRHTHPTLGVFQRRSMQDTRLCDLTVRLGHPYLFMHQHGDCEHIVVFRDVHRIPASANQNVRAYPRLVFECRFTKRKCIVCNIYPAKHIAYADLLSSENPSYYCDECFLPLHMDVEGRLVHPLQSQPYLHDAHP